MGIDRKLARIALPVLLATASQSLAVAGRSGPAGSTATSHRSASSATAKPAEATHGAKSPVTISFTSSMRHGNLVVMLDGVPVFNEEFQKPLLIISQTTTWDPVQVSAGKHKLTAKVYGTKDRTFVSDVYKLDVSGDKGFELRFRIENEKVTVEKVS